MNARDTERVLKELQAFEDGLRPTCTLTWKHLAKVVHFTDRTLRSKPKIRARFEQVQNALLGKGRIRRSTGMVHDDLQRANDRLRGEVRRYKKLEDSWLERWARIAASLMAHGMSIDQFDVDLPLKNERRKD
jgi:hypothetical protein